MAKKDAGPQPTAGTTSAAAYDSDSALASTADPALSAADGFQPNSGGDVGRAAVCLCLPPELWLLILRHLGGAPKDLSAFARVCRAWFSAALPVLWRHPPLHALPPLINQGAALSTLSSTGHALATATRYSMYSSAIRTLTVAILNDPRLRSRNGAFTLPTLRELRLFHNYAFEPVAFRKLLGYFAVDEGGDNVSNGSGGSGGSTRMRKRRKCGDCVGLTSLEVVTFTARVEAEASVNSRQTERLEAKASGLDLTQFDETLLMLAQTCPRLVELDLGPILLYSDLLEDICRDQKNTVTQNLADADGHDGKGQKSEAVEDEEVLEDGEKGGWRVYANGSKKQSVVGCVAAASVRNLFARLHTLRVLIHPDAAPKLLSTIVGGRVTDLTLRFAGDGDAAIRGIATVARLGPQLRRLALQLYGYPQKAEALRPLRALTELHTLGVIFIEAPFSAVQPLREDAVSPAFAAATDEHWRCIAAGMRRLRHLSVRMRDCLSLRTLSVVGELCQQLESLSLAAPCDLTCLANTKAAVVFPSLRELRMNSAGLPEMEDERLVFAL